MATEIENTQAAQALIAQAMIVRSNGDVVGAAQLEAQAAATAPWLFQKAGSGISDWTWIAAGIAAVAIFAYGTDAGWFDNL